MLDIMVYYNYYTDYTKNCIIKVIIVNIKNNDIIKLIIIIV